ncbi:MAG: hypothetical protein R2788_13735 [Saprospiraceae bacterium]
MRNEETREFENFVMSINRVNYNFFDLYEMEFVNWPSTYRRKRSW